MEQPQTQAPPPGNEPDPNASASSGTEGTPPEKPATPPAAPTAPAATTATKPKPGNASTTPPPVAAVVATAPVTTSAQPVSYESLKASDRVAVQLKAVQEVREGENKTVKAEQIVAWTKSHFEALKAYNQERFDKSKNGEVFIPELNRRIKLLGVPTFEEQDSEAGGTVEVLTGYTPFA